VALGGNVDSWGLKGGRVFFVLLLWALMGSRRFLGGSKAHLRGLLGASWGSWAIIEVMESLLEEGLRLYLGGFGGFLKALRGLRSSSCVVSMRISQSCNTHCETVVKQ
jgi:hypothetical protein